MRHCVLTVSLAVAIAVLILPVSAVGQSTGVWLEQRVGGVFPTRDLGRTDVLGNAGYGTFERANGSAFFGVGAGLHLSPRWAIRLSVDRSLGADVQGEWRCVPFVACPAVLLPLDGELDSWTFAFDAMYSLPTTGWPLSPYAFVGFGVRRSDLQWREPAADVTLPAFSFDETEPMYRLGIGFERVLWGMKLFGEFEATSTRFGGGSYQSVEGSIPANRPFSVDLGLLGGIRVPLP